MRSLYSSMQSIFRFSAWQKRWRAHRIKQILKKSHLFIDLTSADLQTIAKSAEIVSYKKGDLIIKEGEDANDCYVILSGEVQIKTHDKYGQDILLSQLSTPAHFGEQALLDMQPQKRNASVIAISAVNLIKISATLFVETLNRHAKMKFGLRFIGNKQLMQRLEKQVEIFRLVDKPMENTLAKNIGEYQDGEIVFRKNDEPDYIYYIISGAINIILDDTRPGQYIELKPGQIFGELSFMRNSKRRATALAKGTTKLLLLRHDEFSKLYASTPTLRDLIGALNQTYESPSRGVVSQYTGKFLGANTVNTTFQLFDGRLVIASHVIGKNVFSISHMKLVPEIILKYEKGNLSREIQLRDNKIIGAIITGYWDELSFLCSLVLDGMRVTSEQISLFKRTGSLNENYLDTTEVICECMSVSRSQLIDVIQAGKNTIKTVCAATGAGLVCGSCRPKIYELLGHDAWQVVSIHNVIAVTANTRAYHLKPNTLSVATYLPGQHIIVQMLMDNIWIERTYTLTSVSGIDDDYQITIEHESTGAFSGWLFTHDHQTEPLLIRVSEPQGQFVLNVNDKAPAVFFAAGIGVTPALAYARAIAAFGATRQLHIDYSAHNEADFIFKDEFSQLQQKNSHLTINFRDTSQQGRLDIKAIAETHKQFPEAEFYICGADEYIKDVEAMILSLGVSAAKIHYESFKLK